MCSSSQLCTCDVDHVERGSRINIVCQEARQWGKCGVEQLLLSFAPLADVICRVRHLDPIRCTHKAARQLLSPMEQLPCPHRWNRMNIGKHQFAVRGTVARTQGLDSALRDVRCGTQECPHRIIHSSQLVEPWEERGWADGSGCLDV